MIENQALTVSNSSANQWDDLFSMESADWSKLAGNAEQSSQSAKNNGSAKTVTQASDAKFLTEAAAKLGIDGGEVSASFTDKIDNLTLKGEVKDKFDFHGSHEASLNFEASTPVSDHSSLFASANGTSLDGDVSRTYTAGLKYSTKDEAAGTSRTGQVFVSNKDGDTSSQIKGGLKDALTENATLNASIQFDLADGDVNVKQTGQLDLRFPDAAVLEDVSISEYLDSQDGGGFTASAGVEYKANKDTSFYANVSHFDSESDGSLKGAQLGVKTKINEDVTVNAGGYIGDYTEFKDAKAPTMYDEGVFANLDIKFGL